MSSKAKPKQLTSWSFSRYADYQQCPLKCKLKHLDKISEPPNDAMARGTTIHKQAEAYVKGTLARLPAELKLLGNEFRRLRKLFKKKVLGIAAVEDNWAFTKDWELTRWDDWANCWLRVKLDAAHYDGLETVVVTDWKTGKFRPTETASYEEQLELQALAALLQLPHVETIIPRLGYTDAGVFYPKPGEETQYHRSDVPKLKQRWEKRVRPMLSDQRFAPRPNDKCCWCHYRAANKANGGGQCKY